MRTVFIYEAKMGLARILLHLHLSVCLDRWGTPLAMIPRPLLFDKAMNREQRARYRSCLTSMFQQLRIRHQCPHSVWQVNIGEPRLWLLEHRGWWFCWLFTVSTFITKASEPHTISKNNERKLNIIFNVLWSFSDVFTVSILWLSSFVQHDFLSAEQETNKIQCTYVQIYFIFYCKFQDRCIQLQTANTSGTLLFSFNFIRFIQDASVSRMVNNEVKSMWVWWVFYDIAWCTHKGWLFLSKGDG